MTAPHDAQGISALPRSIAAPQPSQMMAVAPGSALNSAAAAAAVAWLAVLRLDRDVLVGQAGPVRATAWPPRPAACPASPGKSPTSQACR